MAKKQITEIVTRMVPIADLKPDPKNPRSITEEDFATLVDSMLKSPRLLWLNPLVVDKKGIVKVGNQRLRAALELGWTEIPAKSAEDFTPKELKELMIKENLHQGHWLFEELEEWETASLKEWGMKDLPEKFAPTTDPTFDASDVTDDDIQKAEHSEKEFAQVSSTKVATCPHCGEDFEIRV